jgi:hypothetical protein
VVLSGLYFHFSYFEPDTASYLFQARLFAEGRLAAEAPPAYGFSPSPHINILYGKWYSKYPFGNALMLMFGVFVGAPWLIPALASGGSLLVLYYLARDVFGERVALIAVVAGLISPATLGMGSTWFSEPVSRFFLALYLFGLLRALEGRHIGYALLSGFALGYAFNTRPMPTVAFGVGGALLALYSLVRGMGRRRWTRAMGAFLLPFSAMMGLAIAWNAYFTGNPFRFTHNAAQRHDILGFGRRTEGYDADVANAFLFTPQWAVERLWRHVLPCVSFNTLGWGYYQPGLLRSFGSFTDSAVAGVIVKSPADGNWVTLKLWGHGDGAGQLQFQTRGDESAEGLTGRAPGFAASRGRTDLRMRLVGDGVLYTAFYRTSDTEPWRSVGPATVRLTPPLEVGVYAGVASSAGRLVLDVRSFRVAADTSRELVSDEFDGPRLAPVWRWGRRPKAWTFGKSGLLIEAPTNSNLFTEDRAARLFQTTSATEFDVEAHVVADWRSADPWLLLRALPLLFPFALLAVPLIHPSRSRHDVFLFGLFVLNLAVYVPFYFEGSTWGITPVSARYYTEVTLLGIIPLVARGADLVYAGVRRRAGRAAPWSLGVVLALLTANTVHTYVLIARPYQNWSAVYQRLPVLVKERALHNAVVFVPNTRDAPLGDYPFRPLRVADVVYFKLGPSKVWRLTESDWREVYQKYFRGRAAYRYEQGGLARLDPQAPPP